MIQSDAQTMLSEDCYAAEILCATVQVEASFFPHVTRLSSCQSHAAIFDACNYKDDYDVHGRTEQLTLRSCLPSFMMMLNETTLHICLLQ